MDSDLAFEFISALENNPGAQMNDNRMKILPTFVKSMMRLQDLALHNNEFVDVGADIKVSDHVHGLSCTHLCHLKIADICSALFGLSMK